jgi:hypothetical protein
MASAALSRRVEKVVGYPPLSVPCLMSSGVTLSGRITGCSIGHR